MGIPARLARQERQRRHRQVATLNYLHDLGVELDALDDATPPTAEQLRDWGWSLLAAARSMDADCADDIADDDPFAWPKDWPRGDAPTLAPNGPHSVYLRQGDTINRAWRGTTSYDFDPPFVVPADGFYTPEQIMGLF